MNQNVDTLAPVPPHVPTELVYEFFLPTLPGAEVDSVQAVMDALKGKPPIFFGVGNPEGPGSWVATTMDMMRDVFQRSDDFSNYMAVNFSGLVGETWPLRPLEIDPPEHGKWRALIEPMFAPAPMRTLEGVITAFAAKLVDGMVPKGGCEFVEEFAMVFPVQIFLRLIALPLEQTAQFMEWEDKLNHGVTMAEKAEGAKAIVAYLRQIIAERRQQPGPDILSQVVNSQVDGQPLTDDEAVSVCMLLYSAGLDTVTASLGFIFRHLAENPDDQQRLRDEPGLIPHAIEELMRAYSTVPPSRIVTHDLEFHGISMKKGDRIMLPTMAAGRDPAEFPDPAKVDFDRENVSHIAFAAGRHRCAGSHLARRELRIAVEQWLKRVPPFRIADGKQPVTHSIGVFGFRSLQLAW